MAIAAASSPGPFVVSGWIGVLAGAIGLAGAVAFVLAYLKASVTKTTIDNYRAANDSLNARVDALESDVEDGKRHQQKCEAELEAQKRVNEVLSGQVTAAPAINELRDILVKRFDDLIEGQDHMAEAMGGLVYDLRRREGLDVAERRHSRD